MNQTRSTILGLALSFGLASSPPSASAANGSSAPTPPANGAPSAATPATPPSPTLSDLGRSLRSYFTEEELALLFEYMRDSVIAAFKDEEVTLPPDLSFKLEILLVRMKKEGGHYMDNLIKQLEKDLERNLKEKLKEKLAPPDTSTSTYTPPQPQWWTFPPVGFPPAATMPAYPPQFQQQNPQQPYPQQPYPQPAPPFFSLPYFLQPAPTTDP